MTCTAEVTVVMITMITMIRIMGTITKKEATTTLIMTTTQPLNIYV